MECLVEPGEHPLISRRSYVRCDEVRAVKAAQMQHALRHGNPRYRVARAEDASAELVAKLQAAVMASTIWTSRDVRQILSQQGVTISH